MSMLKAFLTISSLDVYAGLKYILVRFYELAYQCSRMTNICYDRHQFTVLDLSLGAE